MKNINKFSIMIRLYFISLGCQCFWGGFHAIKNGESLIFGLIAGITGVLVIRVGVFISNLKFFASATPSNAEFHVIKGDNACYWFDPSMPSGYYAIDKHWDIFYSHACDDTEGHYSATGHEFGDGVVYVWRKKVFKENLY